MANCLEIYNTFAAALPISKNSWFTCDWIFSVLKLFIGNVLSICSGLDPCGE